MAGGVLFLEAGSNDPDKFSLIVPIANYFGTYIPVSGTRTLTFAA